MSNRIERKMMKQTSIDSATTLKLAMPSMKTMNSSTTYKKRETDPEMREEMI